MQQLSYHVAVSVDGFIAQSDGGVAGFVMEGDHAQDYLAALREVGTVLMGRRTYQVALDWGVVDPYPHAQTLVFSRSMEQAPHPKVQLVGTELVATVAGLRERDGRGMALVGGGQIAAQLLAAGLIDELVVKVNPFVMGAGIPLFDGKLGLTRLAHRWTKVFANGVVTCAYRVNHDAATA